MIPSQTRTPTRIRVEVTPRAARRVRSLRPVPSAGHRFALRIAAKHPGTADLHFELGLSALSRGDDIVLPRNGFDVVVDRQSAEIVDGLRVDYVDSGALEGFLLTARAPGPPIEDWAAQAPSGQPFGPPELVARVHEALNRVRPLLQADGGDVVLLGIRDGAAYVRLTGACSGCSAADQTLANVVEHAVRTGVGEITHTVLMS